MNLLELPVLFCVLCLALHATKHVDGIYIGMAWAFVVSRAVHSAIHLTYNNVMHRLVAFSAGAFTLIAMRVRFADSLA